jgi:anti-sigma factor RsiW
MTDQMISEDELHAYVDGELPADRRGAVEAWLAAHAEQITTIGLDIAKNVFQVHGIDASENVVVRKQLRRSQVLGFLQSLVAVPYRHGSLRHGSLLGA